MKCGCQGIFGDPNSRWSISRRVLPDLCLSNCNRQSIVILAGGVARRQKRGESSDHSLPLIVPVARFVDNGAKNVSSRKTKYITNKISLIRLSCLTGQRQRKMSASEERSGELSASFDRYIRQSKDESEEVQSFFDLLWDHVLLLLDAASQQEE